MPKIPTDTTTVDDTTYTEADYEQATTAGRNLRDRITADPTTKARYDRAMAEIETRLPGVLLSTPPCLRLRNDHG